MIGAQVREYTFQRLLGQGGMGSVYLATHTLLNQRRAIKLLHPELTRHPAVVQRFLNEARAVARLVDKDGNPHRNLIHAHELFQDAGTWYMVMDYLEGEPLSRHIDRGKLPLDRVVHIVGGVANALKIAHANNIIHRDLKPDNVFITVRQGDQFHVVLLDFGVAQLRNDLQAGPTTKNGVLIGTPHFMAPEQLAGRPITPKTDLFALGILAYMMITGGAHPWQHEDATTFYKLSEPELYVRMTQQSPVDPRRYLPALTEDQARAILAPLAVDPVQRPSSAAAFAILLAERAPSDGVSADGLAILREWYPELLELDNLSETVRAPRPASMPSLTTGLASKYRLVSRLGAGGMAEVFLARTLGVEGFERTVAIKRIFEQLSTSPAFAKLFIREAQLTARLSHPNIVPVIDFSRDPQERLFLVMEHVDGKDLSALLESGPLPPSLAVFITTEILRGLGYAHALTDAATGAPLGVVHRDISPHNVLLGYEGAVKVCDFGLARALAASNVSSSNHPVGKPAYMSPEQVQAVKDLDGRSDLFAVGVMLHEMLTGRPLFTGGSFSESMAQVMFQDIEPPSVFRPGIPPQLDAIVMRLLERDRTMRYQRAEDAVAELLQPGLAPLDGRGELVATLGARRPRTPKGSPAHSLAAGEPSFSSSPLVSVLPSVPYSTPSSAASEAMVRSPSRPAQRGRGVLLAGLGVLLAATAGVTFAIVQRSHNETGPTGPGPVSSSSRDVASTTVAVAAPSDASTASGAIDAAVAGTVSVLDAGTPSSPAFDAAPEIVPADAPTAVAIADANVNTDAGVAAVRSSGPTTTSKGGQAPRPTVRATGELLISCNPWCEIWIDGSKRASTISKKFVLQVGVHRIRLVHPEGKAEFARAVTISVDKPQSVEHQW